MELYTYLCIRAGANINFVAVVSEKISFAAGSEGETRCHNISIIESDECNAAVKSELSFTSHLRSTANYVVLDTSHVEVIIDDRNSTECGKINTYL